MKNLMIAILIASTLAAFVGVAALWQIQTRDVSPQDEQVTALKNEQALEALRNEGKKIENQGKVIENEGKKIDYDQAQATALRNLPGVKKAAEMRAVVQAWFPVMALFGFLFIVPPSILVGLVIHRKTQLIPIEATATGIKTHLPTKEVSFLCLETTGTMKQEAMARTMAFTEGISQQRFQQTVQAVSAIRGVLPKSSAGMALQEALPPVTTAIPAFTGQVFLSQCRQDSDYEDGFVCWGRNCEDGWLVQMPLEDIQSLVKDGLQGQGKTVATLLEIYSAWYRKYVKGENIRTFLIDRHAGFDQSLSNRIEDLLPGGLSLFDSVIKGADIADNGELLAFLTEQLNECNQRQTNGMDDATLDVIVFDEYTETVTESRDGQAIERIAKRLLNYRKALKYMSVVVFESTKNKNSAKGTSVTRMGKSKMLFAGDPDDAGRFIGWKHVERADELEKGQCLLKLADVKDVVKIQLAQVSEIDFAAFKKFVTLQDDAQGVTANSEGKDAVLPVLPSAVISAFIDTQKTRNKNYSQGEFARQCDINKGLVSRALKDDPTVSAAAVEKMLNFIATQERKVIPFRKKEVVNA